MNQSAWTSVGLLVAMVAAPPLAAQSTASLQAGLPGQPIARRTQRLPPQTNIGATLPPCGPAILSSPSLQLEVLAGPWQVCATPAWPFSAAYSPSGSDLYVPLFGGFLGGGGCTLARVDPVTFQLLATLPTGESPQEVAFVTWPNGSLRLGFVSCSSSSTVTVFDAANQVIATIPIPVDPSGPFATAFPFGLAVSPNGTHVHVGTGDGQGRVHAIDVGTLALDPSQEIQLGPDHGTARMAFCGSDLVLTVTRLHPGFSGATASIVSVDPRAPQSQRSAVLASDSSGALFPSPQDLAIDCDGIAWVAGYDMGAQVFGVDIGAPMGPRIVRTMPTRTLQPDGKFQGLGLSSDGLLAVGDFWTSEVSLIDVRRGVWRETIDLRNLPGVFRAPQDIAFSSDGARMIVPCASTDTLAVFAR